MQKIIMVVTQILTSRTAIWIITFQKKYVILLWKIYTILSVCGMVQLEDGSSDKELLNFRR